MTGAKGPSLVIEASTSRGSVALVADDRVIVDEAVAMRGEHAERLLPTIAAVLEHHNVRVGDLSTVICGAGPGGFTSLRIAAAIAKGLVEGGTRNREGRLASVPSLALIVAGAVEHLEPGPYVAAADALRGEHYAALFEWAGTEVFAQGAWRRVSATELARWADEEGAHVIGPGRTIDAWPKASGVVRLRGSVEPVDAASWEPDYGRPAEAEMRRRAAAARGARA
jgi:tRNA threonylcarbamoyladenosine biosynthesis protein TsaB